MLKSFKIRFNPFIFPLLIFFILLILPGGFSAYTWEKGFRWFYFFSISLLLTVILVPISNMIAVKFNAIDIPDQRRIHKYPIPRFGGMAIWLSFIISVIRGWHFSPEIISILIASSLIYMVGALDDIKRLSVKIRLFIQLIASIIIVAGGISITFTLKYGILGHIFSYLLTIVWLVGITNAFNFMDGIDGLASSMGFICSILFLLVLVNTNQYQVSIISASLAGCCIGFLKYNWNPAKVFLGDGGSTLIGFLLGTMAIYGTWSHNEILPAISLPLLILSIPIYDLVYTTISRIKNGKVKNIKDWLEYAGLDHLHHRLLAIGFDTKKAVIFISLLNILLGLEASTIVVQDKITETFITIIQVFSIFIIISFIMIISRNKEKIIYENYNKKNQN
jgi:UDP-GlcNAc:undecaprenyl-phosphate GlcNAc-1-phosphate transferase